MSSLGFIRFWVAALPRRALAVLALKGVSAVLPVAHPRGSGSPVARDASVVTVGPVERSSQRLLGALEQLEKRIYQLEHTPNPPLPKGASLAQAAPPPAHAAVAPDGVRIAMLLGKGQSLLHLDQAEEALACFDQVLELDSNHPEALVKKGAALERLRKMDEAITCYDQAIAADGSMTAAYLHKGGLLHRIERFGEARQCYEQALRTQENGRG